MVVRECKSQHVQGGQDRSTPQNVMLDAPWDAAHPRHLSRIAMWCFWDLEKQGMEDFALYPRHGPAFCTCKPCHSAVSISRPHTRSRTCLGTACIPSMSRFQHRVVLVADASGAIGSAVVARLLDEGATIIAACPSQEAAQGLRAELNDIPHDPEQLLVHEPINVGVQEDAVALAEAVRHEVLFLDAIVAIATAGHTGEARAFPASARFDRRLAGPCHGAAKGSWSWHRQYQPGMQVADELALQHGFCRQPLGLFTPNLPGLPAR